MRTALRHGVNALVIEGPVIWMFLTVTIGILADKTVVMITARDLAKQSQADIDKIQLELESLGVEEWDEISYHPHIPIDIFVAWGHEGERELPEVMHWAATHHIAQLAEQN